MPGLTVAIPAHDAARTIAATLGSALAQEGVDLEVIVVDDRSTDATCEIALDTGAGDPRLRVVESDGAAGAAGARNTALRAASSPWVAFLDDDDRWLPGHAAALLRAVEASPGAVACFGAARHVDQDGALIRTFTVDAASATLDGLLERRLQPTTSAAAVHRETALALGGFDDGFELPAGAEDTDLWWRLAQQGPLAVQPEPLVEYVVDDARLHSRSRHWLLRQRRDRERVVARMEAGLSPERARAGAAAQYAILARYWLAAGFPADARYDARRALALGITREGIAALGLSLAPRPLIAALRRLRRQVVSRGGA